MKVVILESQENLLLSVVSIRLLSTDRLALDKMFPLRFADSALFFTMVLILSMLELLVDQSYLSIILNNNKKPNFIIHVSIK